MAELTFKVNVDANGMAKVTKLSKGFTDADKKATLLGKTLQKNRQDLKRVGMSAGVAGVAIGYFAKHTLDSRAIYWAYSCDEFRWGCSREYELFIKTIFKKHE
jgi:hypothetical protein